MFPKQADGLKVTPVEDGFMIYQPSRDRVHYLNHTALVILELCTGENSPEEIAQVLQRTFGVRKRLKATVEEILTRAKNEGLTA